MHLHLHCIRVACTLSGKDFELIVKGASVGRECAIELRMDGTSTCWAGRVGGGLD